MKSWLSMEMYKFILKFSPLALMVTGYYHFFINYEIQFYNFDKLVDFMKLFFIIGLICLQSVLLLIALYFGTRFWKKAAETAGQ